MLYDDTNERAGVKFANMDLIGLPYQVAIGPRSLSSGTFDVKQRFTGKHYKLTLEALLSHLTV